MALQSAEPPASVYKLVTERLAALAHDNAIRTARLRWAQAEELAVSTPHRVALLTAGEIAGGGRPRGTLKGWRFLVHQGDHVTAAVDTVVGEDGTHRFGHINEGALVAGTEDAIRWAEAQPAIAAGRFEPVLALVPQLRLTLLLLRDLARGGKDYFVALGPAFHGLQTHELLRRDELAARLKGAMEKQARRGAAVGVEE